MIEPQRLLPFSRHPQQRRLGVAAAAIILLASFVVACASIMGVDKPELDPSLNGADSSTTNDGTAQQNDGSNTDPDAGCLGAGCPCIGDNDCADKQAAAKCVNSKCAACLVDTDCPANRYCLPTHECAPGCKNNDDCKLLGGAAPFCNTQRHQCVQCTVKSDCDSLGVNLECSPSGACAAKCNGDASTCPVAGQKCCANLCIDVTKDLFNCGSCSNQCMGGNTQCCNSTCSDPLTNVNNCGTCGTVCVSVNGTPSCGGGLCKWACTPGYHHCTAADNNSGCETRTNTTTQCGGCNVNCNSRVDNATGIACGSSVPNACTYNTCENGSADCNGNKADGCECGCGKQGQVCCPTGSQCNSGLNCSSGKCAAPNCKAEGVDCSNDNECCSDDCHSNGRCRGN